MSAPNHRGRAILALGLIGLLVGCGGTSGQRAPRPAPSPSRFPPVEGRTVAEIAASMDRSRLVVSPTGLTFDRGKNRYAFGVFTLAKEEVDGATVALYISRGASGTAIGPLPARMEHLQTPQAYRAQTTSLDPEAARAVYVVPRLRFTAEGEWRVLAVFQTDEGPQGAIVRSATVGEFPAIPSPGERAPKIHTPTAEDVGGNLAQIDTRIPPDQMHEVDFADAYGKQPIALLLSTPQFCQSRVCGPVVDIAEEVNDQFGEEVAFIHMEVYNRNDPSKGVRPQLRAFHLETEPWLFVIDRSGRVSSRIEGGFSASEARRAIEAVTSGRKGDKG